jgi:hypothetical protein
MSGPLNFSTMSGASLEVCVDGVVRREVRESIARYCAPCLHIQIIYS